MSATLVPREVTHRPSEGPTDLFPAVFPISQKVFTYLSLLAPRFSVVRRSPPCSLTHILHLFHTSCGELREIQPLRDDLQNEMVSPQAAGWVRSIRTRGAGRGQSGPNRQSVVVVVVFVGPFKLDSFSPAIFPFAPDLKVFVSVPTGKSSRL